MPEIPDLEAIRGFFNERIVGLEITAAEVSIPVVVRTGATDFVATMTGNRPGTTLRQGKFLLMPLADEQVLVINAMLTGRFQYTDPKPKKRARTCFTLTFENGKQLRYSDQLLMGKVYLVPADKVMSVPMFAEMGRTRWRSAKRSSAPASASSPARSRTSSPTTSSSPASATPTPTRSSSRRASIRSASAAR